MAGWDDTGFVCASKYRIEILRVLLKHNGTPRKIAEDTKIRMPHVSRALRQLEQKEIVKCLTPDRFKGKIFGLTDKGIEIAKRIEKGVS
jgi:DNA-binding MarR family transcriptional regulator